MRFGCQVITYGEVKKTIECSLAAEKAGFDIVSLPDHLFHPLMKEYLSKPPWDTFIMLGAIARETSRVKLMPGVTDPLRRHPATIAHAFSTLDVLSDGRAILGMGAGEAFNIAPLELDWRKPVKMFEESIRVIKLLWTSNEPVSFKGEFFKLKNAYLSLKPVQKPHPPIYVGGFGPRMRLITAMLADGWLPWLHTPKTYLEEYRDLEVKAKKCGRSIDEIDTAVMLMTCVFKDGERAWETVKSRVRIGLTMRAGLLRALGYNDLASRAIDVWRMEFTEEQREAMIKLAEEIPEEVVEEVTIAGTPEEAIEKISEFEDAGVKTMIVIPHLKGFDETIKNYREKIIPYFKEESK